MEAVGVVQLLGNVGEHHGQARGWSVGLPPLRRFIPIRSRYRPFSPGLLSVLPRLQPSGTDDRLARDPKRPGFLT
jgi:hypothetical protein